MDSAKPRQGIDSQGRKSTINTANIGRKPKPQAEKNLTDLNSALNILATLPFDADYAVETFADQITNKADAAIEWIHGLGQARQHPEEQMKRRA